MSTVVLMRCKIVLGPDHLTSVVLAQVQELEITLISFLLKQLASMRLPRDRSNRIQARIRAVLPVQLEVE